MTTPPPAHLPREIMAGFGKTLLEGYGYEVTVKDIWSPPDPPPTPVVNAGVFITPEDLTRAKQRMTTSPWSGQYQSHRNRAMSFLNAAPNPYVTPDMSAMVFAWTTDDPPQNSLNVATNQFEKESDKIRTLALEYALTGEEQFANKAIEMMLAWAAAHTEVNMYRDFHMHPGLPKGTIDGMTQGFDSDRPWDFALNAMWDTYGLTNICDAYELLARNGYAVEQRVRSWIVRVAHAVNSSFHAWTKWADPRVGFNSYERYRTDNHLSWCHVGLLSAAVALGDPDLANYVLRGGEWDGYRNPSHTDDVLDRAIESSAASEHEGRIYEEKINRGIGYALFHLKAMSLVAQIAKVNFDVDVWHFSGSDGGGIKQALDRYAAFVLGTPGGYQAHELLSFELGHPVWSEQRFMDVLDTKNRNWHSVQAIGPVAFLLGSDG